MVVLMVDVQNFPLVHVTTQSSRNTVPPGVLKKVGIEESLPSNALSLFPVHMRTSISNGCGANPLGWIAAE